MEANSLVGSGAVVGIENSFKYLGENTIFWASATFQMPQGNMMNSIGESHFHLITIDV